MTITDFARAIEQLALYFGKSPIPKPDQVSSWFKRVEWIESSGLDSIVRQIEEDEERFPANIPRAFSRYHANSSASNFSAPMREVNCPDCLGGYLFCLDSRGSQFVYRCSTCKQAVEAGIPCLTKEAALANGWDVITTNGSLNYRNISRGSPIKAKWASGIEKGIVPDSDMGNEINF
jgi:hypothetical protein